MGKRDSFLSEMTGKRKNMLTVVLMIISALFVAVGVLMRQNLPVLFKAVRICLECIGIG